MKCGAMAGSLKGDHVTNYVIGSLFPRIPGTNDPNVILSSSLAWATSGDRVVSTAPGAGILDPALSITTNPVTVPGVESFLTNWLIPQVSNKSDSASIFSQYFSGVLGTGQKTGKFYSQPLNKTLETLALIGYRGQYYDYADASYGPWSSTPKKGNAQSQAIFKDLRELSNYKSQEVWGGYQGEQAVKSRYDLDAVLQQIAALDDPSLTPDLWYPSLLYTYGTEANGTNYPGPVLIIEPGDDVAIRFSNQLEIEGLTQEQSQKATIIPNSTLGNSASDGLGANTSVNYHLHGSHTFPAGFGDNVIARYTTGQSWTTDLPIPFDHGQGSYWYHPHYHPSVNQQVYSGLSGFMQIGDPLSKIAPLKDVPRNLAVLKTLDVALDADGGAELTGIANLGPVANRMTMNTVNGEFQPKANAGKGGWQAITVSNQANQAFYNISFINHQGGKSSTLPFYIYGEDGHQYPQIRAASEAGVLGQENFAGTPLAKAYAQADGNLMMLAPAKRLDLLVYLPEGTTELASLQQFDQNGEAYFPSSTGTYPSLSLANTEADVNNPTNVKAGPGPLATFTVEGGPALPSADWLNEQVSGFNQAIQVQEITPTTRQEEYNPAAVPSVNLFAEKDGEDVWTPIRNREFHWTKNVLAGPKEEYDAATQQLLAKLAKDGVTYDRYTQLPLGALEEKGDSWLGYNNPFLINDHVFPNGTLNVSQLGTVEEWTNWNYSIGANPSKYIAHPFHIHINDYQVKNGDETFADKRSLEDVTPLNSSGYKFWDPKVNDGKGAVVELAPLKGDFLEVPEAVDPTLNPSVTANLATYGANGQTIRMMFQDYVGAYVFHCHILPHEDAGMMLAMLVIENTRDSLLLGNELFASNFVRDDHGDVTLSLLTADHLEKKSLKVSGGSDATPQRSDVGDLTGDFVQDVVIASRGDGMVRVYDGAALKTDDRSKLLGAFRPYAGSDLAPWVFVADVNGDNGRDITTAGFTSVGSNGSVSLNDLAVSGWQTSDGGRAWSQLFSFDPFDSVDITAGGRVTPVSGLTASDVSVSVGDHNLDNFNDVAIAYRVDGGVRVVVLDGAASALTLQTGTFEGGYFPDKNILADVLIEDQHLASSDHISLSSGYNLYAQNALENLLLTSSGPSGSNLYTLQLQAGHFIATSAGKSDGMSDGAHAMGGGHGAGVTYAGDHKLTNFDGAGFAVHLVDEHMLTDQADTPVSVTPVFAGGKANAGLLVQSAGDGELASPQLLFPTGNQFNGQASTSDSLLDNAQQLVVSLNGLNSVSVQKLEGVGDLLVPTAVDEQRNLLSLLNWTYFGATSEPTPMAQWSARLASGAYEGHTIRSFTQDFIGGAEAQAKIFDYFGCPLGETPTSKIVETTYDTLFARRPSSADLARWNDEVSTGRINPALLPLAILQSAARGSLVDSVVPARPTLADPVAPPDDQARLALLAAGSQWNDAQWANNATIDGSYGQGLSGERLQFEQVNGLLGDLSTVLGLAEAQLVFDRFTDEAIVLLGGEELSNSGFF